MKILHTSDWHIGQNFYSYDRTDEHRYFFSQLSDIISVEKPDVVVVSGDIFHNSAPSASAQHLMVESVMRLHDANTSSAIVLTAGNHDSATRLDAHRSLWRRLGIFVVGGSWCADTADRSIDNFIIEVPTKGFVVAVPFFHPSNFPRVSADSAKMDRQSDFFRFLLNETTRRNRDNLPIVLMAHLAVEGCDTSGHEDHPVGGIYSDKLSAFPDLYDYFALGHIHMPQQLSERAFYSGSAIPVSFSESYVHSVNLIEIERHGALPVVRKLPVSQLREVKTIPSDGAPLDKALSDLHSLSDSETCYVRLLVDEDGMLPPDAEDRARKAVEGKSCRFCEIRRKPRESTHNSSNDFHMIKDLSDIEVLNPLDIAKSSFKRSFNSDMTERQLKMLMFAIDSLEASSKE